MEGHVCSSKGRASVCYRSEQGATRSGIVSVSISALNTAPASYVIHLFLLHHRKIHHPNILTYLDVKIKETSVTILSNLVKGHDLHALIFDPNHHEV